MANRHCAGHISRYGHCLPRIQKLNSSKSLVVAASPGSGPGSTNWFPSEQSSWLAVDRLCQEEWMESLWSFASAEEGIHILCTCVLGHCRSGPEAESANTPFH